MLFVRVHYYFVGLTESTDEPDSVMQTTFNTFSSYSELAASQGDFIPMYGEKQDEETIVYNNVTEAEAENNLNELMRSDRVTLSVTPCLNGTFRRLCAREQ